MQKIEVSHEQQVPEELKKSLEFMQEKDKFLEAKKVKLDHKQTRYLVAREFGSYMQPKIPDIKPRFQTI